MTYRELFTQLYTDLRSLDPNEPTLVIYDYVNKELVYRQVSKLILFPYLGSFYFLKKGFKVGVLTQSALNKLLYNVEKLLSNTDIDNCILIPHIEVMKTSFYKNYKNKELIGPQKLITLEYANITNKFITKYFCKYYNNNTALLWRSYKLSKNQFK